MQDKSGSLLDTLVTSLQSAFLADEIKTEEGQFVYLQALGLVATYAAEGYLTSAKPSTIPALISTLSSFINSPVFAEANSTTLSEFIATITDNINKGVLKTVIPGQAPLNLVSDFVQVLVQSSRSTSFNGASLAPPLSEIDAVSRPPSQGVILGDDGLFACYSPSGYSKVALTQWVRNPFSGSRGVLNPLIKVTVYSAPNPAGRLLIQERSQDLPFPPKFYITMQFSRVQNFNFSVNLLQKPLPENLPKNASLPDCTLLILLLLRSHGGESKGESMS